MKRFAARLAGLLSLAVALFLIVSGIDLWGRAFDLWGWRDSPPGVYVVVGVIYVGVAAGFAVPGISLFRRGTRGAPKAS